MLGTKKRITVFTVYTLQLPWYLELAKAARTSKTGQFDEETGKYTHKKIDFKTYYHIHIGYLVVETEFVDCIATLFVCSIEVIGKK